MSTVYVDGNILAASFKFTHNTQDYIVNSVQLTYPTVEAVVMDETGRESAFRSVQQPGVGTMEVSVTATAQVANLFGAEVTIPANYTIAGADLVVVILGQNNSSAMNTPTTRTLNIRQKINVA